MTDPSRKIPSYLLHKPTGQARVRIDGRDHYLGKHGTPASQAAYRKIISEWLTSGCHDPQPAIDATNQTTIAEMILAFWSHAQKHYRSADGKPSEELGNLKVALRPLRWLYGSTIAKDFGPLALRAVREEMVRSGLARNSVNARVNRIRRVFKWAASVELIPVAVAQALATVTGLQKGRTEARETEPVGPVALAVVEATLPHLPRPVAGLVRLQLLTGMRPGEACALRGRDLIPGEPNWTYVPESHKTAYRGRDRSIPIGPKALSLVREYLRPDLDAYLFSPADAVADYHAARTESRQSRPTPSERAKKKANPGANHARKYSRSSYLNAIVRACDRAFPHPTIRKQRGHSLPDDQATELLAWKKAHRWHPNQLRHTAATTIRARYGLEAAQVVLGHARADVSQVYAERDLAKAHEVMREIG